jgi:hypothetical protein
VLVREELDQLLRGGVDDRTNIISALVDVVTRLVIQQLLEAEQSDALGGRGRYERRGADQRGSRNGYEPGRVRTAEGAVDVRVPQVRDGAEPYRSSLMSFLEGNSEVLDRLVTEMYARGLSTRDVEDAFRDATGELLISRSAVSAITDQLWEDYQAFVARDLSDVAVEYLFCDAAAHLIERPGSGLASRQAGDPQNPHGLDVSVSGLRLAEGVAGLGSTGSSDGVLRIGLASPPAPLAVRAVDLQDVDTLALQLPSEAGAIVACALDADQLDVAEGSKPSKQTAVAGRRGLVRLHAEQRPAMIQSGADMDVEVGVDTPGDTGWHRGHRHPFVGKRVGWHHTCQDDGQDGDGPARQAPSVLSF